MKASYIIKFLPCWASMPRPLRRGALDFRLRIIQSKLVMNTIRDYNAELGSISVEILIISTNTNRLPMPVMPYGACIVAEAAERAGHGAKLLDLMFEYDSTRTVESELMHHTYDIIGLSIRNIDNNDIRHPAFFFERAEASCAHDTQVF